MSEALQEFVDSSGVTLRVDRANGVLRGVKLIGLNSKNGRSYRPQALREALALYEGAKVNVNHPKSGPLAPRDYQERLGVIKEVEYRENDGLFGDLHYNPKHPLAEQLAWDAEHNPRNVGVSHNVLARVSRENDQTWVEEITHVQSVDLVADPASTAGLYEHTQGSEELAHLTLEILEEQRPDLLAELRTEHQTLRQRSKVLELLCEQGMSLQPESGDSPCSSATDSKSISRAFFNTLLEVSDERKLEQLIREQAELIEAAQAPSLHEHSVAPQSKDQLSLLSHSTGDEHNSAEFAKSLKLVGA